VPNSNEKQKQQQQQQLTNQPNKKTSNIKQINNK